jgi:serine/threonine-protein kinase
MSRVFVAEETSLGRKVVVKVVPSDLAGSIGLDRFRREIGLAAQLQHPHIVPLFAAGELDGVPFYTMPFVEGESLRARLTHGELPIADTISILRDVAKALDYAHGRGVAHRDIKPDNVLLAGTSALLTDFGVAKALSDSARASNGPMTATGVSVGTPAYMAPEQAAADPATDVRADVYAYGVMAYEMLAGHVPFAGRSAQAMMAANAVEAPVPIASLRPMTPPALADLVMRCLEKRPADRPQRASQLLQVLETVSLPGGATLATNTSSGVSSAVFRKPSGALLVAVAIATGLAVAFVAWRAYAPAGGATEIRSIAVLPFENRGGDTSFNYLEDGITDHVRDALHDVPSLTVKARSSSLLLKGRSVSEVGAKLGVDAVLQGEVNRSSSRLHVVAELVRTTDDVSLWSSTFDAQPGELSNIQDTIVRAITSKLRPGAPAAISARRGVALRGTTDVEAYELFLRGRYAVDRFDTQHALELLQAAVRRDPRFARALGYLAVTYANAPLAGTISLDPMLAKARSYAEQALAIDSTVVEAYVTQSFILASDMKVVDALKPLERALSIDSTNADVMASYAGALAQVGRASEALAMAKRGRDADPLSPIATGIQAYVLMVNRQYAKAIAGTGAVLNLDPMAGLAFRTLGFLRVFTGAPDSAVKAFEAGYGVDSADFGGRSLLVFGYAAAGRWPDAIRQRALMERESGGNSPSYRRMIADLAFSDFASAMTALERGVANREPLFSNISIPCDPILDPLKSDPRFNMLMRRLGTSACPATGAWRIPQPPR